MPVDSGLGSLKCDNGKLHIYEEQSTLICYLSEQITLGRNKIARPVRSHRPVKDDPQETCLCEPSSSHLHGLFSSCYTTGEWIVWLFKLKCILGSLTFKQGEDKLGSVYNCSGLRTSIRLSTGARQATSSSTQKGQALGGLSLEKQFKFVWAF